MHAEILTKRSAERSPEPGTWGAGLAAIAGFAQANGMTPRCAMRDGSGLSRMDSDPAGRHRRPADRACAPALVLRLVRFAAGGLRPGPDGRRHAAQPDVRHPRRGNARGKTGSLTGISALSGYVTSADNEPLVFSVLLNQYLSASPKDIEDKIAIRLAQFSRTAPADVMNVQLRKAPADAPEIECSWLKPAQC